MIMVQGRHPTSINLFLGLSVYCEVDLSLVKLEFLASNKVILTILPTKNHCIVPL
jgi:hypothetical protein